MGIDCWRSREPLHTSCSNIAPSFRPEPFPHPRSCLQTHLKNRNSCPSCSRYITVNDIYPNFVLQEVANRASEFRQLNARGPMHVLRRALSQSQADLTLEEVQVGGLGNNPTSLLLHVGETLKEVVFVRLSNQGFIQ